MPVEIPCSNCGASLVRIPYRVKRSHTHFCNQTCKSEWQKTHLSGENSPVWKGGLGTYICQQCGKSFDSKRNQTNKFCSRLCRQESERIFPDETKPCVNCGKEFTFRPTPTHPEQSCCSRACSNSYRANLHNQQKQYEVRPCAHCGNEFEMRSPDTICCSVACSNQYRGSGNETIHCKECGKTFDAPVNHKRQFCSTDCHRRYINKQRFGPRRKLICVVCGKVFSPPGRKRQSKCCSVACRSVYYRGPNSPTWQGGWAPYYGEDWNEQKRKVRKRDGYRCQHCGITEKKTGRALDVHHIQKARTFHGDYTLANALENLILLCRKCHKLAEYGKIAVQPKLI